MADQPSNTALSVWHRLVSIRDELIHNLSKNPAPDTATQDRLAAIEEQILRIKAPDLRGTILKLELLWSVRLHEHDQDSRNRVTILAELRAHV